MNVLAWLRKLGYRSDGLRFRNELIDLDALEGLTSADRKDSPDARGLLLNGYRRPDAAPGPWQGVGPILAEESAGRRLMLVPRVEGAGAQQSVPFVGREGELRLLLSAWRAAASRRGRVVLLSGEAGIGKSRMIRELCERQAVHPHLALWHRCSPEHASTPLHPLVSMLEQSAGCTRQDQGEQRLAKLEALLTDSVDGVDPHEGALLLAALLGVDAPDRSPPPQLTPERLRARVFDALLAWFEGLARRQMVLAVYEDLQWADPSTLEFLERMVERIPHLPVLALMTFRPEFEAAWGSRACAVTIALPCLARDPCRAMVEHLSGAEALAEPVLEEVIARSRGVPLLVEELTKAVLELADGVDGDAGAETEPAVAVPPDLLEAVIGRLDRSPEAAAVAGIGAVIGREFSHELLAAIAGWPEDQLRSALDRLVASGLIVRHGVSTNDFYAFKHGLIQDAAYRSLPEPVRQSLHHSVARVLEECWPDVAASTPELMARHYAAAGESGPAVAWWLRAGKRAADRSAHAEAITLFSEGLELLDSLPATPEQAAYRAGLLAALARTLTVTKGADAPEVERACSLAHALCQGAEPDPQLLPVVRTLWDHYNTRAEFEAACELAGQCHRLAAAAQDSWWLTEADFCLGVSSLFVGRLAEARDRLTQIVVRSEGQCGRDLARSDGWNLRIVSLAHLAQALWLCGYPDQAARASQEAVAAARAAGYPFGLTYALVAASWVFQLRREAEASCALAAEALALAAEADFPAFSAMATILRDATAIDPEAKERAAAAAAIGRALDAYRMAGAEIARPYLLGLRAEVHEAAAETEQALAVLAEAAEVARTTGECWYEPEIRRREGELLLRQSITNRRMASARFCQAIAVANQEGGKSLELRAAVSLARLWSDLGRRDQARDLLAPVYGWFKEGFDTADLMAAKALLDELS